MRRSRVYIPDTSRETGWSEVGREVEMDAHPVGLFLRLT